MFALSWSALTSFNMRLINTSSMLMEEFHRPPDVYAILSHTWGDEEVSYQEFLTNPPVLKAGYRKIMKFCKMAAADGWEYAWVDTCCIDKSSSTELNEAINSMFEWYRSASVCFVYMADVMSLSKLGWDDYQFKDAGLGKDYIWSREFQKSKWFCRGWTLQELLAPPHITFFNSHWECIGTRSSLKAIIERVTRIFDLDHYETASTAQIFSWASQRETTRIEDQAYCLLGLVRVNMPLLYGEGQRAFLRLQREILAQSDDDSIFAWEHDDKDFTSAESTTILAESVRQFGKAHRIQKVTHPSIYTFRPTWSLANHGLNVVFRACLQPKLSDEQPTVVVVLNCSRKDTRNILQRLAIELSCVYHYNDMSTSVSAPLECRRVRKDLCEIGTGLSSTFHQYWERSTPMYLLVIKAPSQPRFIVQPVKRIHLCRPEASFTRDYTLLYCMWSKPFDETPSLAYLSDDHVYLAMSDTAIGDVRRMLASTDNSLWTACSSLIPDGGSKLIEVLPDSGIVVYGFQSTQSPENTGFAIVVEKTRSAEYGTDVISPIQHTGLLNGCKEDLIAITEEHRSPLVTEKEMKYVLSFLNRYKHFHAASEPGVQVTRPVQWLGDSAPNIDTRTVDAKQISASTRLCFSRQLGHHYAVSLRGTDGLGHGKDSILGWLSHQSP